MKLFHKSIKEILVGMSLTGELHVPPFKTGCEISNTQTFYPIIELLCFVLLQEKLEYDRFTKFSRFIG